MSDTAVDGFIETAMKIRIYRHPTHPDQRPQHNFDAPSLLSRHFDRPKKAAAVRDCSDLKQRHISRQLACMADLLGMDWENYLLHH